MGYDLHITRKKNWDGFEDEHGPEISLDEWIAMVRADAEMPLDGFCEVRLPHGKVFRLDLQASQCGPRGRITARPAIWPGSTSATATSW